MRLVLMEISTTMYHIVETQVVRFGRLTTDNSVSKL